MSRAKAKADRVPDDLYVTPPACVAPLLDELAPYLGERPYVVDAGAGSGAIAQAVLDRFPRAWVDACELRTIHDEALQAIRGPEFESQATGDPYQQRVMRIHWGDFLTTLPNWGPVTGYRQQRYEKDRDGAPVDAGGPDLVIANPPFSLAEAFVRRAVEIADEGIVAMLVRVALVESQERYAFWVDHPPLWMRFLVERPSFTVPDYVDIPQQPDLFGEVHDVTPPPGGTDLTAYAWIVWEGANATYPKIDPVVEAGAFGWYRWR